VAGWQTVTSLHWVGYTFPVGKVTGVRAQWTEPSVTGPTSAQESVWIGIGGWDYTEQNLLQDGTFAYFASSYSAYPNEGMWYELVPKSPLYPLVIVNPGDEIAASIVQLDPPREKWQLLVYDVTSGLSFTKTVRYDSLDAYPSFVVEDPLRGAITPNSINGPFVAFPRWGSVSFSNMQVRIGDQWRPAASIYGYRVQMVRNGRTLATAGPLDRASGFTAHQGP
jgi:Peptidase A4 family